LLSGLTTVRLLEGALVALVVLRPVSAHSPSLVATAARTLHPSCVAAAKLTLVEALDVHGPHQRSSVLLQAQVGGSAQQPAATAGYSGDVSDNVVNRSPGACWSLGSGMSRADGLPPQEAELAPQAR
jgi:hypothetical protein